MANDLMSEMETKTEFSGTDAIIQDTRNNESEKKITLGKKRKASKQREGIKITSIAMDVKLHQALKKIAADNFCKLQDLVNDVLTKYANKQGYNFDK